MATHGSRLLFVAAPMDVTLSFLFNLASATQIPVRRAAACSPCSTAQSAFAEEGATTPDEMQTSLFSYCPVYEKGECWER